MYQKLQSRISQSHKMQRDRVLTFADEEGQKGEKLGMLGSTLASFLLRLVEEKSNNGLVHMNES